VISTESIKIKFPDSTLGLDENIQKYLFENNIGIFILLNHLKATEWPIKGKPLKNDPIEIPIVWGFFSSEDGERIKISYGIHPMKCFPQLYLKNNKNSKMHPMSLEKEKSNKFTFGGCQRVKVRISGRDYSIKAPDYCSIFGLPDDCYDADFENTMIEFLKDTKSSEIWAFENTSYIETKIEPHINIKYMKSEFLPDQHFPYVDSPYNFLRGLGIYSAANLESITEYIWYKSGKDFINERDLDSTLEEYRLDELALDEIYSSLIFEFLRQYLLLIIVNSSTFERYN
jgi:hypothetical protein